MKYWVNEDLRQTYNTSDMEHSIAYMIATLSHVMSLKPGDVILGGHQPRRTWAHYRTATLRRLRIEKIGRNSQRISDPMKRTWDPQGVRKPEEMAARRESMKGTPNNGTWPFQPKGG